MDYDPAPDPDLAPNPGPEGPRPPARTRRIAGRSGPRRYRRWARWTVPLVVALFTGGLAGVLVGAVIHMPRVDALVDFEPGRITQLYDRSGEVFASYARERRVVLTQDEIPDLVRNALVAVEDSNFYRHGGLDALGVLRAAAANLRSGHKVEGASTLTMQLARQLFALNPEKTWRRKIREALLAVELEKSYSKQQLLTLYLNFIYLGHGQYGVEAASRFYFGKSVGELTLAEAATLVGIYQRPGKLSPYKAPDAVKARRDHVLGRMRDEGFISPEECEAAAATPLEVVAHRPRDEPGAYFAEEVRRHLEAAHGATALLEGGLQVETTLDRTIQRSAETALRDGLLRLDHRKGWRGPLEQREGELEELTLPSWNGFGAEPGRWFQGLVLESNRTTALVKLGDEVYTLTAEGVAWTQRRSPVDLLRRGDVAWFRLAEPEEQGAAPLLMLEQEPALQGAAIVLESSSGAVRAMVGGWDFSRNQFNRATQAQRQPGSAFKLFVYGAALEAGFTPADTLFDAPVYLLGSDNRLSYSPTNYYPTYYGITTLARALEKSYNVTAVKLLDLVGVEQVIDFARRAGVESELPPYPSLALGSADLVPLELAAAYAAIANQGTWVRPYLVESVRTPEGRTLEEHLPDTHTVTTPQNAYVLTTMLEGVVDRGTAVAIRDLDLDIAGKTGTTNDYNNAWFVGFTPRYTLLVWVGYDQLRSLGRGMAGDKVALPIWREIAVDGLESGWLTAGERFTPPPGVVEAAIHNETGLRAPGGPGTAVYAFLAGTEPVREHTPRWDQVTELPWYMQRPFYIPKEGERMPEDAPDDLDLQGEGGKPVQPAGG